MGYSPFQLVPGTLQLDFHIVTSLSQGNLFLESGLVDLLYSTVVNDWWEICCSGWESSSVVPKLSERLLWLVNYFTSVAVVAKSLLVCCSLLFGASLSCFIFYHVVKVVLRFWLLGLLAWSGFEIVVLSMGFSKVVGGHLKWQRTAGCLPKLQHTYSSCLKCGFKPGSSAPVAKA